MKTPTRTWKLVHALHSDANELLVRGRLAFQKLVQNSPNKQKLSKTGVGYD